MESAKKPVYFVVFFVGLLYSVISGHDDHFEPLVKTNLGNIRGRIFKSDHGAHYFSFRGIPYAKPPVKDLRFKAPQPVDKWEEILNATDEGHMCIQFDIFQNTFTGDEDCLTLNVYSPKLDDSLPIMFFIHGGGFFCGSGLTSMHGEQRFMDKEVVLVTTNYRLGPFGFLSTGDETSPGNYGMLDQVLALRWVQDNIAAFGGDPNRVTIFGESAGGASVTLHMLSPLSKGLFHGVISQSGSATAEWATQDNLQIARQNAINLAKLLHCPTDCTKKLVGCLRKRAAVDIVISSVKQTKPEMKTTGNGLLIYVPVVDKAINGDQAFLPDRPIALLTENKFNGVPTIAGVTKDEGLIIISMFTEGYNGARGMKKEDALSLQKSNSPYLFGNANRAQRVTQLFNEHFKTVDESNLKEKITAISSILSDAFMEYPADDLIVHLATHRVPIFAYKLTHRGKHTAVEKLSPDYEISNRDWQMVTHLDDLQYLFRSYYFLSTELPEDDMKMADIMLTLWINFAKTKMPTLDSSTSNYSGFEWFPATTDNFRYLDLSLKPKMVDGHLCERYDRWKTLFGTFGYKDEL